MKVNSIINVREDAKRPLSLPIEGDLAKIVGKTESRFMEISRQKGPPIRLSTIAIDVRLQGLSKHGVHVDFLLLLG
jgi:hypothetical protein